MKWQINLNFKVKEKIKITPEEIEKVEKEMIEKSKKKYSSISSVGVLMSLISKAEYNQAYNHIFENRLAMYSALNSFGFRERDYENPETFKKMIDFLMKQEDIATYGESFFTIRHLNNFSLERIKKSESWFSYLEKMKLMKELNKNLEDKKEEKKFTKI